eukprot:2374194-Alexandrium_andersonii.AAC.1
MSAASQQFQVRGNTDRLPMTESGDLRVQGDGVGLGRANVCGLRGARTVARGAWRLVLAAWSINS